MRSQKVPALRPLILIMWALLSACSAPLTPSTGTPPSTPDLNSDVHSIETVVVSALATYPLTQRGAVIDSYFGQRVSDPYRWLEDDMSAATGAWVDAQNSLTFGYLERIAFRQTLKQQLTSMWNYTKVGAPFERGDYRYYYQNNGLQNQYVVYRQKGDGDAEVFLDPNTFSADGTTSMSSLRFSRDGSLAAYSISEGGSDWRKIVIIDVESKRVLGEPLVNIKFSDIAWFKNHGFYYSSYAKPEGSELSAKTDQHVLYYHRIGTQQRDDEVIFGATNAQKHRYVSASVSQDDRYLAISAAASTSGNRLFLQDLVEHDSQLVTLQDNLASDTLLLENQSGQLYLMTNRDAPNNKIVTVDATAPSAANWIDLVPETEHVLSASTGGGYIFTEYMVDAVSKIYQYDYGGVLVRQIPLPGVGSSTTLSGRRQDNTLYYSFSNYKTPETIYALDANSGEVQIHNRSGAAFNSEDYVSKQVFYSSPDGTRVPMIITHKKGLELNAKNPTILYGYGGFNISLTPRFSIARALWMQQGGIYAVANLRGGGEYGKHWHDAGTQQQKQNVFDDFIAAAQYLIDQNYTSSDHLALSGGSNGGLLVAAVMIQRPDLMAVALPAVGVLDMLRYHKFTAGAGWAYDYGTADQSAEMFQYLYNYSPVHNVTEGVAYPATLITTGDHDDRVVPAHSFKFAAELQSKQGSIAPTLIRIETDAGHGAGTPVSKTIEKYADIYAFTFHNMGIKTLDFKSTSCIGDLKNISFLTKACSDKKK